MPGRIVSLQNDRVDQICQRVYGSWTGGIVERVYAANSHLPAEPAVLPAGIVISLPDPPAPKKVVNTVKLWGSTPMAVAPMTPALATGEGSWLAAAAEQGA